MDFARINSNTICYTANRAGGDRPWLAFVNSLGTDHRSWDALTAILGDRWNTLTYDKRGHGLSDTGETPYSMDDHVADLGGLLDHLEIDSAAVCGLSVGGMIAMGLAAARADKVSALILADTGHRIGDVEFWNARIEAIRSRGLAAVADGVLQRWFTEDFRANNSAFRGWRNMLLRSGVEGYTATCAALRDTDMTELARTLDKPTLCVVGAEDGATPPELVQELAGLIPGARFEVIADAGHQPEIEKPEVLAGLIAGFLEEQKLV